MDLPQDPTASDRYPCALDGMGVQTPRRHRLLLFFLVSIFVLCIDVHIQAYISIACIYMYIYRQMHICIGLYIYNHIYIYMCIYREQNVCVYVYTEIYVFIHMLANIYIYIYIYIEREMHAYLLMSMLAPALLPVLIFYTHSEFFK